MKKFFTKSIFIAIIAMLCVGSLTAQEYTITVSSNPPHGGGVAGGGVYSHGMTTVIHAIPFAFWNFINWTEEGVEVFNRCYIYLYCGKRSIFGSQFCSCGRLHYFIVNAGSRRHSLRYRCL